MRLEQLMNEVMARPLHDAKEGADITDITKVVADSRQASSTSLFICIEGERVDGHKFVMTAYNQGCRAFLVERQVSLPPDALVYLVTDTKRAKAMVALAFYGHPERLLRLVGITGTKGKTTTALMAKTMLCALGVKTGYIGTSGIQYGDIKKETANTTPDALVLAEVFSDMAKAGVRVVVLEVSSQALYMARVYGITFDITAFTNLAPDHIGEGEHPDFSHYKACKATLFSDYGSKITVYDADEKAAKEMLKEACAEEKIAVSFGKGCPVGEKNAEDTASVLSDIRAENIKPLVKDDRFGMQFLLCADEKISVFLPMAGEFNVKNALLAVGIVRAVAPFPLEDIARTMADIHVKGRLATYRFSEDKGVLYVIDYAHNAYALSSVLATLRKYTKGRLMVLFGSVGERTATRRQGLGKVASSLADIVVLTADNPRCEPLADIFADIKAGMETTVDVTEICDRSDAIQYIVNQARQGDVVLLSGKGDETYQEIGKEKRPYQEKEALFVAVAKKTKRQVSYT